ncbi:matrixin family metalloprotease [Bradyrhizobium sp. AZCC 2289]|uniref:matrixin family metalloprotease n=1 Tax=Bradyrhizobium sp. AZCC 2289 TaxID=3117026 RepID=UPI002FEF3DFE
MPTAKRAITHLRVVQAGAEILLAGSPMDKNTYEVTIRSKFERASSDSSPICGPISWSPRAGVLVAKDDRLPPRSVWQIELVGAPRAAGNRVAIEDPSFDPSDAAAGLWPPLAPAISALFCENWVGKPPPKRKVGFAGRVALEVSLPSGDQDLDSLQRNAVKDLITGAAALWVAACRECPPDHLAVIWIGNEAFVRSSIGFWLDSSEAAIAVSNAKHAEETLVSSIQNRQYFPDARPKSFEELLQRRPSLNSNVEGVKSLEPYVSAKSFDKAIKTFCAIDPARIADSAVLTSIHKALCRPNLLPRERRARIAIEFRPNGATYCGSDPEIIACRADSTLTEFNTRDFRFRMGKGVSNVGMGPVEIDFVRVLVHEMGHWIGLRHLDGGKSIMASSAERARCIDENTIGQLLRNRSTTPAGSESFLLHDRRGKRIRASSGANRSKRSHPYVR